MEKKRQHYVPRFYLRNFCNSQAETVGVFVLESGTFRDSVPIRDQAYENYLYGKESNVEDALAIIENRVAPVIRNIINTSNLPPNSSEEYQALLTFAIFQHARTISAADELNEFNNEFVKSIVSEDPRLKGHAKDYYIRLKDPVLIALAVSANSIPLVLDLKCKLVKNQSDESFLASDNPAVFYNQYFEKRDRRGSNTGLACKGLQVFLPISPKFLLVFYDGDVYRIGSRSKMVVETKVSDDISNLNLLQVLNAHKCVYFDQSFEKRNIEEIVRHAKGFKQPDKPKSQQFYAPIEDNKRRRSMIWLHKSDLKCNLQLSFTHVLKKARAYDLGGRAVHVRDENLFNAHQQTMGLGRVPSNPINKPTIFSREKPSGWDIA